MIKLGTSTLTQGTQKLSRRYMLGLVQQIATLKNQGVKLMVVSSGAIATGRDLLSQTDRSLPSKQICASIGQIKLMQVWSELFALFDLQVGQVLLTKEDFSPLKKNRTRYTLNCLLQNHIIPIINENDTVTTKESCIGNNDHLAALVAKAIEADTVILLTDQEGLYTADPHLNPDAKLISIVPSIDETICAFAGGSSTPLGHWRNGYKD